MRCKYFEIMGVNWTSIHIQTSINISPMLHLAMIDHGVYLRFADGKHEFGKDG